jgi:hypothetical protein
LDVLSVTHFAFAVESHVQRYLANVQPHAVH